MPSRPHVFAVYGVRIIEKRVWSLHADEEHSAAVERRDFGVERRPVLGEAVRVALLERDREIASIATSATRGAVVAVVRVP